MTITLSADLEARLKEKAAREGRDPDAVAEALLIAALDAETIEVIRQSIEDSKARRVISLEDFDRKMRTKYSIPDDTPLATEAEMDELSALMP